MRCDAVMARGTAIVDEKSRGFVVVLLVTARATLSS